MIKPLRYALVFVTFPPVWLVDRWQGCDPPASFRRGMDWARTGTYPPAIWTAPEPAVVRRPPTTDAEEA